MKRKERKSCRKRRPECGASEIISSYPSLSLFFSLSLSLLILLNPAKAAFPTSRACAGKLSKTEISRDFLHPGAFRSRDNSIEYRYRIGNTPPRNLAIPSTETISMQSSYRKFHGSHNFFRLILFGEEMEVVCILIPRYL